MFRQHWLRLNFIYSFYAILFHSIFFSFFCRKIAVFSELGKMFWSSEEPGDEYFTRIFSSSLAGTDVTLLHELRSRIQDLKIDYSAQRLYWLDAANKIIYSMSVHGPSDTIKHTSRYGPTSPSCRFYLWMFVTPHTFFELKCQHKGRYTGDGNFHRFSVWLPLYLI